jgi:hypothetical protein
MSKVTGRVEFEVDGETMQSESGATLNPGGFNREGMMDDAGNYHYTESHAMATAECTIMHTDATDITRFNSMVDVTINFKCDTGQVYTIGKACLTEPAALSGGKCSLKFAGPPAKLQ